MNKKNYNTFDVAKLSLEDRGMIIAAANVCGDTDYATYVEKNFKYSTYNTATR